MFITVGAMKTAMEWSSRRARHSLVPLCRIVATLEDGPCRDALLEPLLEALPSMAGVSDQELAAHAVSAAKHVAAALSATGVLNPKTVDSPVNVARWDGVVAVFASAVASASEKTDKRKTRDETAGGKFIFITVRAIRLTSCFIYRRRSRSVGDESRRRDVGSLPS